MATGWNETTASVDAGCMDAGYMDAGYMDAGGMVGVLMEGLKKGPLLRSLITNHQL